MDLTLILGLVLTVLTIIVSIPGAIQSCIYLKERWERKKTKLSKGEQNTLSIDHKD